MDTVGADLGFGGLLVGVLVYNKGRRAHAGSPMTEGSGSMAS